MKILNLIQCTNLGGMEQASLRLMRGLMEQGHSVQLLSLNPVGRLGPLLVEARIPHEGLPYLGKGGWRSYGLLKKKLKTIHADALIMTGHHLLGSLALGDFCKGRRVLAIHFHHEGVKSRWQWQMIYRIACSRFDAVTFPCDFIRNEAQRIYPPVARLAHTVRNPLNIPALAAPNEKMEARKALNLPVDRPLVGNAGWLIQRKRFDVFLRTARKILDRNPDVLFAIAGSGEEEQSLKRLADDLGIAGKIRWLGWQREMSRFHKAIDVLLFNSDWDALPTTPLEAMSFGVPAVCSAIHSGLGEIIDSPEVGFLLSEHDTDALASRVLDLLAHPGEATAIGLAGRGHLEKVCEPGPIVDWHVQALSGNIPAEVRRRAPSVRTGKSKPTALIFHRVGPYHFARARAAGKTVGATLIEVFKSDDVYGWDHVPGADGFERVTLFERNSETNDNVARGVRAALERCRPSAVAIPGWADAVAFSAIQWCGVNRVPVIVMSETTEWDEPRWIWKEWIKRRLLKRCASGLVGGQPHADYLARLGMPHERIFQGYDAVDNDYFAHHANAARSEAHETRTRLALPEKYFLASARFVQKKNLFNLVCAYAQYRDLIDKAERVKTQEAKAGGPSPVFDRYSLVLLGDGPLKSDLCRLIAGFGLEESVLLPGFKQYDELPSYYALARAFIHASTVEQWGLVVNEAMASGLPVLVSDRCGCAFDLVSEGVNGFRFDPYDPGQLAGLMARISELQFPAAKFGAESSRIISEWSPNRFATSLGQAVEAALAAPQTEMGPLDSMLLHLLSKK